MRAMNDHFRPKAVIWDFNGTLINDVHICVDAINMQLKARQLPAIDQNTYKRLFTFPVRDYYEAIGFDFSREAFEIPALAFMDLYVDWIHKAQLFPEVKHTLERISQAGIPQYVLSAMEQDLLDKLLHHYQIAHYFEIIQGIDDHFGGGKAESGKYLVSKIPFPAKEILLVGDTLHDADVAAGLGVDVVLVGQGHQSIERLQSNGQLVCSNLGVFAKKMDL